MKYFGIKNQNGELICVATEETIEDVKDEVEGIIKNDCKIFEISEDAANKYIEEWTYADEAKFLCRTLMEYRRKR